MTLLTWPLPRPRIYVRGKGRVELPDEYVIREFRQGTPQDVYDRWDADGWTAGEEKLDSLEWLVEVGRSLVATIEARIELGCSPNEFWSEHPEHRPWRIVDTHYGPRLDAGFTHRADYYGDDSYPNWAQAELESPANGWALFLGILDGWLKPKLAQLHGPQETMPDSLNQAIFTDVFNLLGDPLPWRLVQETGSAWRKCQNENCRSDFLRQRGTAQHGQHREKGVMYCSPQCARAVAQRNRRARLKKEQP